MDKPEISEGQVWHSDWTHTVRWVLAVRDGRVVYSTMGDAGSFGCNLNTFWRWIHETSAEEVTGKWQENAA